MSDEKEDDKEPSIEALLGFEEKTKFQNGGKERGDVSILNPKQAKFVELYLSSGNARASATQAGFAPTYAQELVKVPAVKAAIDLANKSSIQKGIYNSEKLMSELNEYLLFARDTGNATAAARLIELKAKHMGLLIERLDVRQQTQFAINVFGLKTDEPSEDS